jgi:FkbM family methyltransferase
MRALTPLLPFIQTVCKFLDYTEFPGRNKFKFFIYLLFRYDKSLLLKLDGKKILVNPHDGAISPELIPTGSYEKHITNLFKNVIRPGDVVLDVGANIGYYTIIAAEIVGKQGRVYAFEPSPNNYLFLTKNVAINGFENVTTLRKAVSEKTGYAKLFYDDGNLGKHSFSSDNISGDGRFANVATVSLDDMFSNKKVDVIKIDIEGAEGLLVTGAKKLLRKKDLKVFLEFWPAGQRSIGTNPNKTLTYLKDCGFKICLIDRRNGMLTTINSLNQIIEACEDEQRRGHEGDQSCDLFLYHMPKGNYEATQVAPLTVAGNQRPSYCILGELTF